MDGKKIERIQLLGSQKVIKWEQTADALTIKLPTTTPEQPVVGFKIQIK